MAGINHIHELTQSMGKAAKTPKSDRTGAFNNALSQALDKKTDKIASEIGITSPSTLGEIPATGLRIQDPASIVSGSTDKLLGLLDAYTRQLEDPGISLRAIAPILEQINEKAGTLLKETASLGTASKGLKDIATQTVVAARTEYMRFQRGDYL